MVAPDYGIDIVEFLQLAGNKPILDVRTPSEFVHGHIPGAFNLPLFENEERARIGTLYNHAGSDAAVLLGMEIVGPRMKEYMIKAQELAPDGQALLYCWRGGMRSNSLAWLLSTGGMNCQTLKGGYKAYRGYTSGQLRGHRNYLVLGGMTGSGKTDLLKALQDHGEQVLDLESLASHKGSAFGAIGERQQPSQEQFENLLYESWKQLDSRRPIWIEDESIRIGSLYIPRPLFNNMKSAPVLHIGIPLEERMDRLIRDYARVPAEDLVKVFINLRKRLGDVRLQQAINALNNGDYREAARIALEHYDKVYDRQLKEKKAIQAYDFSSKYNNLSDRALDLINYCRKLKLLSHN